MTPEWCGAAYILHGSRIPARQRPFVPVDAYEVWSPASLRYAIESPATSHPLSEMRMGYKS